MVATKVSPLAPKGGFPDLAPVAGVRFSTAAAGVKYRNRDDVLLVELCDGTAIAGVFTRSATRSAAVLDCQSKIGLPPQGKAAILVNSGNANAFTGKAGDKSVSALTDALSRLLGTSSERIFTASTGVIGEPLPHDLIVAKLSELHDGLSANGPEAAARAIMTTDTFPKGAGAQVKLSGKTVTISGIAKGSGMIAPDMATMLAYVFTDANIAQPLLQEMVADAGARSFNCITVDSDTSTSDTLVVAATGRAANPEITDGDSDAGRAFRQALLDVMTNLAQQVVRDGEGATKFIEVRVDGAVSQGDARRVAMSIANSPLVKTAMAGEDPNWGRIVMAVGKSGAKADRDRLSIWLGDILVAEQGWVSPGYSEEAGTQYMKNQELIVTVDLGLGPFSARVWTCDLTHGYIEINADYRS